MSAVLLGSAFTPQDTHGETSPVWGKVGGWTIRIDRTLGGGCFAVAAFQGGTIFRIGIDATRRPLRGYMLFANPRWASLEVGKEYALAYTFDSQPPWHGTAVGVRLNPRSRSVFLMQPFSDWHLFRDYMKKTRLRIMYRGKSVSTLRLTGSHAAFMEMLRCQASGASAGAGKRDGGDPFSTGEPHKGDPFF